jgi:radical SAM/Cys-rich protein
VDAGNPLQTSIKKDVTPEHFGQTLTTHCLDLKRGKATTLQINVGLLCNQVCHHCHLNAGPDRNEIMDADTADAVIAYAKRSGFKIIDITGGAPELNPNIFHLIESLSPISSKLILRSNLSTLNNGKREELIELLKERSVNIIASFPSINELQADSQRGSGVFKKSIDTLRRLNTLGYGIDGTGLVLDLASNPAGAFLPASQSETQKRFREVLMNKWGIRFNNLFSFANVPLGRFYEWLDATGNLKGYLARLKASFNPCTISGLMCRTIVSVSWDGYLYDCDFNQAIGLNMGKIKMHVSQMEGLPLEGTPVKVGDHCYACTAGAGFT